MAENLFVMNTTGLIKDDGLLIALCGSAVAESLMNVTIPHLLQHNKYNSII